MLDFAQTALTYTVPFLVVLTLVVTIHELGHFWVARLCGVAVDRFSIGFGRAIFSWRSRSGVEWRIGWIPLGGYVRFAGDENAASVPDADDLAALRRQVVAKEGAQALRRYFHFKPLWQRALVVAAGPFANFALAVVVFAALALIAGGMTTLVPRVGEVVPNSPAARAGFVKGDLIRSANGKGLHDFRDLAQYVKMRAEEPIRFRVERAGRELQLTATPARQLSEGGLPGQKMMVGYLGLAPSLDPADIRRERFGPFGAVRQGFVQTADILGVTLTYLRRVATGYESGDQFSGPLGIAGASGMMASAAADGAGPDLGDKVRGMVFAMAFMTGVLSVGIGFANLMPIPVLDGGHLLFYGYEAIARRPLSANVQAAGYRVGFALLLGLMLFVTWNDLQRYRVFHLIGGLFS